MPPVTLASIALDVEAALAARWMGRRSPTDPSRYLVIPPTSAPGSGGDEATVAACVTALQERGLDVYVVTPDESVRWPEPADLQHLVMPRFGRSALLRRKPLGTHIGPRDTAVLLATDVLDGTYSPARVLRQLALLHVVKHAGGRVSVVSFTFRDRVDERIQRRLRALGAALSPRDEDSAANVRSVLAVDSPVAPDIAFLLPGPTHAAADPGGTVVNIHPALCRSPAELERLVLAVADSLDGRGAVRLLCHDTRGRLADEVALERLRRELTHRGTDAPVLPKPGPSEIRRLVRGASCVVTGRMHLAVAALATGVPVVCLTYGGRKFHELRTQSGLDVPLLAPATVTGSALREAMDAACRVPAVQRREAATRLRARAHAHADAIVGRP